MGENANLRGNNNMNITLGSLAGAGTRQVTRGCLSSL